MKCLGHISWCYDRIKVEIFEYAYQEVKKSKIKNQKSQLPWHWWHEFNNVRVIKLGTLANGSFKVSTEIQTFLIIMPSHTFSILLVFLYCWSYYFYLNHIFILHVYNLEWIKYFSKIPKSIMWCKKLVLLIYCYIIKL